VAFLKSLTDERVRWERAPFDHPQLLVPAWTSGKCEPEKSPTGSGFIFKSAAVGKNGRDAALGPIKAFQHYLQP